MAGTFWENSIYESLFVPVCRALLHSIWQGFVLAACGALLILFTKNTKPAARYYSMLGLLAIFVAVNALTVWACFSAKVKSNQDSPYSATVSQFSGFTKNPSQMPESSISATLDSIIDFSDRHAALILTLWLAIFLLRSVRTAAGLHYHRRLTSQRYAVRDDWSWQLRQLAVQLSVFQRIALFESPLVSIPVTLGTFQPAIVVPLGFLAGLSHAHVEAILLHEIAHIRRRDYLVNALQCLLENIYFFNPGFMWISARLREEREYCCDELVVRVTGDRASYVNALVAFRQGQDTDVTSLAFPGRHRYLFDRVKRILYNHNKPLNVMEKLALTGTLAAAIFISFNLHSQQAPPPPPAPEPPVASVPVPDAPSPKVPKLPALPKSPAAQEVAPPPPPAPDSLPDFASALSALRAAIDQGDTELATKLRNEYAHISYQETRDIQRARTGLKLRTAAFEHIKDEKLTKLQHGVLEAWLFTKIATSSSTIAPVSTGVSTYR